VLDNDWLVLLASHSLARLMIALNPELKGFEACPVKV